MVIFSGLVSAAPINDTFHLNIQTTFSNGTIETGTFDLMFKITESSDAACLVPHLYSHTFSSQTTDARGILSLYLPATGSTSGSLSSLSYSSQYYLCYYRDGTIKGVSQLSRVPYSFGASQVNVSELNIDSNLDLGTKNVTASSGFFTSIGSAISRVTSLFTQDIDASGDATIGGGATVTGNVTASWFKGIFNWIIGSSQNYLSFNGTDLTFDESALNNTIDLRIGSSTANNDSMNNYIAANNASVNNNIIASIASDNASVNNYITANNQSVNDYIIWVNSTNPNNIYDDAWINATIYNKTQTGEINDSVNNYIFVVNTSMGNYVVSYVASNNGSIVNYIAQNNASITNYIATNNVSMKNYVDWVNSTNAGTTYSATGNLTLNSSTSTFDLNGTSVWNWLVNLFTTQSYVDTQNTSMKNYVGVQNGSLVNYIAAQGYTTSTYVNTQNTSVVNWVSNTFNATRNNYLASLGYATTAYVGVQNTSLVNYIGIQNTSLNNYINFNNVSISNTFGSYVALANANFVSLTDNSMADTLHRHSELSASDGTPDRALVVDAAGNVGIGTTAPGAGYKLDVAGVVNAYSVKVNGTAVMSGTGTTNSIAVWTSTSQIGDSSITETSTKININLG